MQRRLSKNKIIKWILAIVPFSVGVLIYLFFRSRKLFYYQFVNILKLNTYVDVARKFLWVYRSYIPNWVIYSFPDGLWIFSMGIGIMFDRVNYKIALQIYTFIFSLTSMMEVFQDIYGGHGTFLGTYDKADLICYVIGYFLAVIISYLNWKKNIASYRENNIDIVKKEIKKILILTIIFVILGFFPALVS